MAVASSSSSDRKVWDQKKQQHKKKKKTDDDSSKKEKKTDGDSSKKVKKRTTNPGVRVIHDRIYDSENGKTCHQCRQKTRDFAASCKNQKNNKPCPLAFCHTCLLNRYGEKAEAVEVLEDWSCPRCRGICNCSFCRKKRGQQPTGVLLHRAKATGCSSVSELLHINGPENFGYVKNVNDMGASPKKLGASEKETLIASTKKGGKENSFEGKININVENNHKKMKQEELGKKQDGNLEDDGLSKCRPCPDEKPPKKIKHGALKKHAGQEDGADFLKETSPRADKKIIKKLKRKGLNEMHVGGISHSALLEGSPKKPRISNESKNKEMKTNGKVDGVLDEGEGCKTRVSMKVPLDPFRNKSKNTDGDSKTLKGTIELGINKNQKDGAQKMVVAHKDNRKGLQFKSKDLDPDILFPKGSELTTVADIELPLKDVGNALQFLEFCAAFGKILNMKKGQSNLILQELINGRGRLLRREQYSAVVQFHIQLLSLIQKESGSRPQILSPTRGKNSWWHALKDCISESQNKLKSLPFDCLDTEAGGYDTLDSSTKLRLLNYLCDEVLETARIRNWIDDQNLKFAKKAKQAKEKVLAAKDKEKRLKQKMLDDVAKAIIAKNGALLSISEHDKIVYQIKSEAAQAHAEMLESMGMVPKKKQRSDAVRTEPILLDIDGRAYWKLNGYLDKYNILVQDIGTGDDSVARGEKWLVFDTEQEKVIEKHISSRERSLRAQTISEPISSRSIEHHV